MVIVLLSHCGYCIFEEFKEYIEAKFPIFVAEDNSKELLGYLVCRIDSSVVWV